MVLDVRENSRAAITLAVLAVLFLGGVVWAWSQVAEPFPEKAEAAPCTDTLIPAGDDVAPPQVMVTVLNAGGPNGLAGQTLTKLESFGFVKGKLGNAPSSTGAVSAQVWASDPGDPAALLLASYLGKNVDIVDQPSGYPGITIVVGKRFQGVKKGQAKVTAQKDSHVCTPPLSRQPDAA
ncbi:LytR C-terminal domain-containing protein [Pimelobacter simplex]|uniref:LytR family transcriptional regulator n=1 Tax=Nocardioides simplex TaxID=2045 RepID=A0A7J5E2L7_NOCSI|nr:LytR C-terminal domain-containing protein [Pimelobacter simplex]KAB2812530.1 LytR family transcriptional regulator [Pimelobacter simplex]